MSELKEADRIEFPLLPAKWDRTAIRTASVQTLKTLMTKYGKAQLDARLQAAELQ